MKFLIVALLTLLLFSATFAQDSFANPVSISTLTQSQIPKGLWLVRDENIPSEYKQLFKQFIALNLQSNQGKMELFVINDSKNKSDAAKMRAQFENNLRNAGWNYKILGEESGIEMFTAIKQSPARKNIFGFWTSVDNSLVLAMTEIFYSKTDAAATDKPKISGQPETPNVLGYSKTFNLSDDQTSINVMGKAKPKMPSFPALPKKPGKARGYVKDLDGKPLEGAYISVSVTAVGGFYTGTHAKTDANGYYEIDMPVGAAYFSSAGYSMNYGAGRIAVGLYPADGMVSNFSSSAGEVENFVMLPFGIANLDGASNNPEDVKNYYGGSVRVLYTLLSDELTQNTIPAGSEIEITLAPDDEMMSGAPNQTIIVRRRASSDGKNAFYINNIPVGRYKMSARLVNGKPLNLEHASEYKPEALGLKPRKATGSASLLFSATADPIGVSPAYGNWLEVSVRVSLP